MPFSSSLQEAEPSGIFSVNRWKRWSDFPIVSASAVTSMERFSLRNRYAAVSSRFLRKSSVSFPSFRSCRIFDIPR